jgi:hypothetical protein
VKSHDLFELKNENPNEVENMIEIKNKTTTNPKAGLEAIPSKRKRNIQDSLGMYGTPDSSEYV